MTIYGNNHYARRHLQQALDILRRTRTRYPYDKIVSHQFPLSEVNEAFAQQDRGTITRSSLVP
jgi:Zn-dependent alcohol dehydrogenase